MSLVKKIALILILGISFVQLSASALLHLETRMDHCDAPNHCVFNLETGLLDTAPLLLFLFTASATVFFLIFRSEFFRLQTVYGEPASLFIRRLLKGILQRE